MQSVSARRNENLKIDVFTFFFFYQAEVTSFPGSLSFAFPMTREAQEREPRNKVVSQPVFLGQLFLKELCNNAMNVLTSNRTNAFYVHYL